MDNLVVTIKADFVLGVRTAARTHKKVFLAYRMNDPQSKAMRKELALALQKAGNVETVDGVVPGGTTWAPEVRRRIQDSDLIVLDLTGPSREVIFEYGFAGNRDTMPIVRASSDRAMLPRWVTATQIPEYEGIGLTKIAESVVARLASGAYKNKRRRPPPNPGSLVWVRGRDTQWSDPTLRAVQNLCTEFGLSLSVLDGDGVQSAEELRDALRAWVVIGCVDGGTQDYVVHFLMGDIVGRRKAGAGSGLKQSLHRVGIIVVPNENTQQERIADSVRRVDRAEVDVLMPDEVLAKTKAALSRYQAYLSEGD